MSNVSLCFVYFHTYNNYQYRVILGLSHFSLTGTVCTSPNLAKEGARSATIIRELKIDNAASSKTRCQYISTGRSFLECDCFNNHLKLVLVTYK